MKKIIRYSIIALLFIVQLLFLSLILKEIKNNYIASAFILTVIILLFYTYLKHLDHTEQTEYESFKVALWVPIAALGTYYLSNFLNLPPVLAGSSIGIIASFLPNIRKQSIYLQQLPTAIYCGAFVGMSSPLLAKDSFFVLTASVFTAVFLVVSKSILTGVGGKFGTLAFIGVLITYFLYKYNM